MVVILFKYGGGNKGVIYRIPTNYHDFRHSPYYGRGGGNSYKNTTYFYFLREVFLQKISHLPVYSSHKIYVVLCIIYKR